MNKWLKRILATFATLLVILILAVLALPFVIDPNTFKGPLERVAAGQNIRLTLEGPINWQFYPQLGLSLETVVVAPLQEPDKPVARADRGTAAVALMPLLSGQVRVDQFVLDGLVINLVVDEQGEGNWESLGRQDRQPADTPPQDAGAEGQKELDIAVQQIAIKNGSLTYEDRQTGQTARVEDLSVQLSDVNVASRLFPLAVSAEIGHSTLAKPLQLRFDGQLQANTALDRFAFKDGRLHVAVVDSADAELSTALAGEVNLQPALGYLLQIAIEPFNAKALLNALDQPLPATADPAALTRVAFATNLEGSGRALNAENLSLTLDDTHLSGSMRASLAPTEPPTVAMELVGNRIDIDRYLAPATEQNDPADSAVAAAPSSGDTSPTGEVLPLETLRAFNLDLAISFDEIVAMELAITQPRLAVQGNNGLWQLSELSAEFYQGKLNSQGQLDARSDTATVNLSARLDELAIEPLLTDFAEFSDLSGVVSGELQAETRAATSEQLQENLSAAFAFTSPALTFQGINAEYFYCQAATRLGDGDMPDSEWPRRTRITDVEGQLTFEQSRLTIASLVAYVENLVVSATGYLDLGQDDYRIRVPMTLAQEQSSPSGCLVESNFLRNRQVDILGCSGSLEALDVGEQCGLDNSAVTELAKQAVRYNVEKRTDEKKEEIREDLKDRVRERLGDEEEDDGARGLLRDLLNR